MQTFFLVNFDSYYYTSTLDLYRLLYEELAVVLRPIEDSLSFTGPPHCTFCT